MKKLFEKTKIEKTKSNPRIQRRKIGIQIFRRRRHVDGLATIRSIEPDARSQRITIEVPHALSRYLAAKGSVCVDGVSLTINGVGDDVFDVNIVPHTMSATNFGGYGPGTRVNLEVDVIARYVERLIEARGNAADDV